jgi:Zn finger protein HypA/HybF involved in hydrogenase expression
MLEHLQAALTQQGVKKVKEVRIRKSSAMTDGELEEAFRLLTRNTPLADSMLSIEQIEAAQKCTSCNKPQYVCDEDVIDHLFVCPACGAFAEIDKTSGMEIVTVTFECRPTRRTEFTELHIKPHHHDWTHPKD